MSHARENYGLQVALILFTMISVVLGVTTFVFFRRYDEAARRSTASADEARQHLLVARQKQDELNELKGVIGVPAGARLDDVHRHHDQDLAACAANLPPECCSYRAVLGHLDQVIREKSTQLIREKEETRRLLERIAVLEPQKHMQVVEHQRAAAAAFEELDEQQQRQRQAEATIRDDNLQLQRHAANTRQTADRNVAAAQQRLTTLAKQYEEAQQQIRILKGKLDRLTRTVFTEPDGRIRDVNYRLRTAWIDLGRADGLPPHTGFDVYPAAAARLHDANIKGKIEVTRVLGDHLAEATLIEDELTNPMIRGDQIQTPQWDRVER